MGMLVEAGRYFFFFGGVRCFACARSEPATVFSSRVDLLFRNSLLAFEAGTLPVAILKSFSGWKP